MLVGRGEIDLLIRHDGDLVAVEVKTVGLEAIADDPIERIDDNKLRQVRRLASAMRRGIRRVDFVGVRLLPEVVVVNWRANVG